MAHLRLSRLALGILSALMMLAQSVEGQHSSEKVTGIAQASHSEKVRQAQNATQNPPGTQSVGSQASLPGSGNAINISQEEWISIGPFGMPLSNNDVIIGQVNAIAVHPKEANTLYIGASEGGVWKTWNGGANWKPLTDFNLVREIVRGNTNFLQSKGTSAIGAIAIDPERPDTVYVGTGSPNVALWSPTALGMFRSTDGGDNWTPMGRNPLRSSCDQNKVMSQAIVNRIFVTGRSPVVIYAATDMGLFRYQEDGTDCWTAVTNGLAGGNASDLAVDTFRGVFYVAIAGKGIFRSSDPGQGSWNKLTDSDFPNNNFGRIALAFGGRTIFGDPAPVVYAGYATSSGYQLFKTGDGGNSWTRLPDPPDEGQLGFGNAIAVGRFSSEDLYVGQVSLWKALDGGSRGGLNDFEVVPPIDDNSWFKLSCCLSFPSVNPLWQGMDVHADIHDIVFAPLGSYTITPSMLQIVYVANDGGVSRGLLDSQGTITWQPMSLGLAIGQVGTIALDPKNPAVTISGLWHNNNMKTVTGEQHPTIFGRGDGFETGFDPGSASVLGVRTMYHNCNAGFNGWICRTKTVPLFSTGKEEIIWANGDGGNVFRFWSDPYRSGHLLRVRWDGPLFRVKTANTATPAALLSPSSWEAIEPPGRTGNIITMAFRSAHLESQPVYYIGTDRGQIWRGSPEVGWTKICECGQRVNGIGPDLVKNERIFAVLNTQTSPGRIKELTRRPDGTWSSRNIDTTFAPQLDVAQLNSIVVDPLIPESNGTTVYVGTDQGMYRGRFNRPVIGPGSAGSVIPTVFDWVWTRSPGVPNVMVTDIEVHQSLQFRYQTGVIRAATYGRSVFELNRSPRQIVEKFPLTLDVAAAEVEKDGPPRSLNVRVAIEASGKKYAQEAPFPFVPEELSEITLQVPKEIRDGDRLLKFVGWVVSGKGQGVNNKLSLKFTKGTNAVAHYKLKSEPQNPKGQTPRVSISATEELLCSENLSHLLIVTWDAMGGEPAVRVILEITYPDKHIENTELKPRHGSQRFALNAPKGGLAKVKITAWNSNNESSSADATVRLKACP